MNINSCLITDQKSCELCKKILRLLSCNVLWVMHVDNDRLMVLATDPSILEHYWNQKYHLRDPNILTTRSFTKVHANHRSPWKACFGSDCELFKKSGFLYDLYKLFDIEEFVSLEQCVGLESYCFRF